MKSFSTASTESARIAPTKWQPGFEPTCNAAVPLKLEAASWRGAREFQFGFMGRLQAQLIWALQ